MSDYETYNFEAVAKALKKIRKQHKKGKPLVWTGPDRLHHAIAATCPPPSWYFSEEGAEYAKDHGLDFEDIYLQVVFHLGFHNGTVKQEEFTETYKKSADVWRDRALLNTSKKETADGGE